MRYFKDENDQIFALEDDAQSYIKDGWTEVDEDDALAIANPPLPIADLAAAAMSRINAGYSAAIAKILVEYPDAETLSFDKQEAQAREWQSWHDAGAVAADEPATPYLDAMLAERPIGKGELVGRIITKAEAFTTKHGQATGRRQRLEDEVKAALKAEDREGIEAITW